MFGPNDSVTESDIRKDLKAGPAEDEVITAAAGVATGIKYDGNDEILGRISSPREMLGRPQRTEVTVAPDRRAPEARYFADRLGVRRIAGGFPPGDSGAERPRNGSGGGRGYRLPEPAALGIRERRAGGLHAPAGSPAGVVPRAVHRGWEDVSVRGERSRTGGHGRDRPLRLGARTGRAADALRVRRAPGGAGGRWAFRDGSAGSARKSHLDGTPGNGGAVAIDGRGERDRHDRASGQPTGAGLVPAGGGHRQ